MLLQNFLQIKSFEYVLDLDTGGNKTQKESLICLWKNFDPITIMDIDRIFKCVKAITCALDFCPSWLQKS